MARTMAASLERAENVSTPKSVLISLSSGAVAGALARTITAPMERVKVIFQTQIMMNREDSRRPFTGIWETIKRIPREQGTLAFWRGNGVNVIRVLPTAALRFTLFDAFDNLFRAPDSSLSFASHVLAGSMSGGTTLLITYPLDLVRVRLAADVSKERRYGGIVDCLRTTYRAAGVRGVYKGLTVSLFEIMPYSGIALGSYRFFKDKVPLPPGETNHSPWVKMALGCVSGLVGSVTVYPMDTCRRLLMLEGSAGFDHRLRGFTDVVAYVYRREGVRGFYRGCMVNSIRSAPSVAIAFAANDVIKNMAGLDGS